MDEKLRDEICKAINCSEWSDCCVHTPCKVSERLEQAFLSNGWKPPLEPAEVELMRTAKRVQVCINNLTSKGELVSANDTYAATENMRTERFTATDWICVGAKAQLAHCQKTMEELKKEVQGG